MFCLCSVANVLKETAELSGSVEPVPSAAPRDRSIGAENATAGRDEGSRKEFLPIVADNPLISPDSLPKTEGIGSNFRPFGSSRTRPGSVYDASLKSRAGRPEANAAFRRGVLRECLRGRSVGPEMVPQGLEKIDSAPGNGMASKASDPRHLVQRRAAAVTLQNPHGISLEVRGNANGKRAACLGLAVASRPEMVPQRLENIDSAPGNGMAPEASTPNIWCADALKDAFADRVFRARPERLVSLSRRGRWLPLAASAALDAGPRKLQFLAPKPLKWPACGPICRSGLEPLSAPAP